MIRVGQYLNTIIYKHICIFIDIFRNIMILMYLDGIFKYFLVYLNTIYLNT